MENYIDGFVFPVPRIHLNEYKSVAKKVAEIWKEYGALSYFEYVGDDLKLEGTRSFVELVDLKKDEVIVFGWVIFPSKEIRDRANKQVPTDSRMAELVTPLTDPKRLILMLKEWFMADFSHSFSRLQLKINGLQMRTLK